jgi:hypothetical protein
MQQEEDMLSLTQKPEPGKTNVRILVPQDLVYSGRNTIELAHNDSPESLDEDITNGTDRERIDPHHSIIRPAVSTIDKERNRAD